MDIHTIREQLIAAKIEAYRVVLEQTPPEHRWHALQALYTDDQRWIESLSLNDLVFLKVNRIAP